MKYQLNDERYPPLLAAVMGIYKRAHSQSVPIDDRIAGGDALGQAGDPRLDFCHSDYWVCIRAGRFLMGAQAITRNKPNFDEEAIDDGEWCETPHDVTLDAYRIARYPVTVGQFQRFVNDEGYQDDRWWSTGGFGKFREPDGWERQVEYLSRPVVGVSWWEAAAFCVWAGVRLLTEAEWERAARGMGENRFPWGRERPDASRLNFAREFGSPNVGRVTPVGIYPRGNTPTGICDMCGNVWEWCSDWFEAYQADPVSNPGGPSNGKRRVVRGGSWACDGRYCRSTTRYGREPQYRSDDSGFRVAALPLNRSGQEPAGA